MTERSFSTTFWDDGFAQSLSPEGKLLFIYLNTNTHANQAGLYILTPRTITFETGLPFSDIPHLLNSLKPHVEWFPDDNIIWVKNFLAEQAKSPKFITSAINFIMSDRVPPEIAAEFQDYNINLLNRAEVQPQLSLTKRECVIIRDNFTCKYCNKEIKSNGDYEMDHIIPRIKGGKDNYQNLATSCSLCNKKKSTNEPEDVGMLTPDVSSFHASQAIFILKNNPGLLLKFKAFFPNKNVDSILNNVNQRYSILSQDTPSRARASDSVSDSVSFSVSDQKGLRVVKGEGKPQGENATPTSESEDDESLSPADRQVIDTWFSVKGFDLSPTDASELAARVRTGFPRVDILAESKAWAVRKIAEPLTPESRITSQIWNWMKKADEIMSRSNPDHSKRDPNRYIQGKYGHMVSR